MESLPLRTWGTERRPSLVAYSWATGHIPCPVEVGRVPGLEVAYRMLNQASCVHRHWKKGIERVSSFSSSDLEAFEVEIGFGMWGSVPDRGNSLLLMVVAVELATLFRRVAWRRWECS